MAREKVLSALIAVACAVAISIALTSVSTETYEA